jgi:hypothetical protein
VPSSSAPSSVPSAQPTHDICCLPDDCECQGTLYMYQFCISIMYSLFYSVDFLYRNLFTDTCSYFSAYFCTNISPDICPAIQWECSLCFLRINKYG